MKGKRIRITGIVQGVGFRPFIYRLAHTHALKGEVWNSPGGVEVILQGEAAAVERFIADLPDEQPPQADIKTIDVEPVDRLQYRDFTIRMSDHSDGAGALAPPDLATCADCGRELLDPADRRYRYSFINCTNCGPRFSIITALPYDRPITTMKDFAMCPACREEYEDPADRRFHAQPDACADCGPQVWLVKSGKMAAEENDDECGEPNGGDETEGTVFVTGDDALKQAAAMLKAGNVVAVKGLGGYHLACDAASCEAVARLRAAKERPGKPFAVMARDLETLRSTVRLSSHEEKLLLSAQAPIALAELLAPETGSNGICPEVAPGRSRLGVFLPYTPLHRLLFEDSGLPFMVMTSGNRKDEPLSSSPEEAERNLGEVADAFLHHDRPIHARLDDSVLAVLGEDPIFFRRARGYVPCSIPVPSLKKPVLAMGGDLKSSFCLAAGALAFVSQYLGDLEEVPVQEFFKAQLEHFSTLCRIEPAVVVHDLHPGYYSTHLAAEIANARDGLPLFAVQHHHAHVAAVMAEHGLTGPMIGVSLDGAGYGTDGTIWGGEVLVFDESSFRRAAHLRPVPQPGGDVAARECWRMALSHVLEAFEGDVDEQVMDLVCRDVDRARANVVVKMVKAGFNSPLTSSCGRLFDAVAALAGVCHQQTYEGEAASLLEAAIPASEWDRVPVYPVSIEEKNGCLVLDNRPLIRAIVETLIKGENPASVAGSFHRYLVESTVEICRRLRERTSLSRVALSGGVFQNLFLSSEIPTALEKAGFKVFLHRALPPNDGCISLGQVCVGGNAMLRCGLRV